MPALLLGGGFFKPKAASKRCRCFKNFNHSGFSLTAYVDCKAHFGVAKFMHTVGGGYVTAALFVLGISAFYMLKNKDFALAKKSFIVAASFGMLSSLFVLLSGDAAGRVKRQDKI